MTVAEAEAQASRAPLDRCPATAGRPRNKAVVVAKLKGARERKRTLTGKKVEGRKFHAELRPVLVALVRQLRRRRPKGGQWSLRNISAETDAARLRERARASILCGGDWCKRCSQRCRLRPLIC